jgi:hypothetical protein
MGHLVRVTKRRVAPFLGACLLLTGGIGASVLLATGTAQAACGPALAAGTTCTLTGTLGISAGALTLTSPSALGWAGPVDGFDQQLVDTTPAQQSYLVNDATGSGGGWHVTVSATTFTGGSRTLPTTGTLSINGSATSMVATAAPTAACAPGSTCTPPTDTLAASGYPVAITTATSSPTAAAIYDTGAATGLGAITIGIGANPVGWWVKVPTNTPVGSYTSTVTLEAISAP